jgi:hypothetical protein
MNRSMILAAILLCAGCAHTSSTPKAEADRLANDILLGDSQQQTCARGEVAYCKVTKASHFAFVQASGPCTCVPNNALFNSYRSRVTAPTPGTRVR